MPRIAYTDLRAFRPETLEMMRQADAIASDYRARGFNLSLRQLYYQFVARDLIPNSEKSYNRLGRIVNDARLAGIMDWSHIEDRGREAHGTSWAGHTPAEQAELIRNAKWGYSLDLWQDQTRRIEVWVEKQALEEVASRACGGLRVGYFACKGYVSQSEMWAAGRRLREISAVHGQDPLILHLGDHDPSGIDMTRDIADRLNLFAERPIEVRRIALNMGQIEDLNPPPNPAKVTDSRFESYRDRYGDESWELDAVRPEDLVTLIRDEIESEMDVDAFNALVEQEREERAKFDTIAERWHEVTDFLAEDEL
ncbi:MAG: hypothetical protein K0R60_52 [Microbacterium sp.]|jgi:hypothetical protein|nr:hypothetical protein [Microbacterium sp.]